MRPRALLACLVGLTGIAHAQPGGSPAKPTAPTQPQDPYAAEPVPAPVGPAPATAPVPAPVPAPTDPVLAEQVAASLVQRAQELFDARVFVDAKQLAVEALVKSPKGPAAERARFLIKRINQQLGITEPDPAPTEKVDLTPIEDPTKREELPPEPERPGHPRRLTTGIHAAGYAGLIGATVGSFFDSEQPAGGAVPVGVGAGLAAGYFAPKLVDRLRWNEAQVRTVGSATVWGGVIGGFFGDISNVGTDGGTRAGTTASDVLVGASVGATLGGAGGVLLAREDRYTTGDIALVDTLAGIGTIGGLTLGMLMQPAESEAYSLNAALGAAGGVVVGLVAAPQTNTTPRRMVRVAGLSAAGGALPLLLYAGIYDDTSHADERVVGLLSSIGLVAGAYVGFRLTRNLDVGKDYVPGKSDDDAPPSLLGRSSSGRWGFGGLAPQPLSRSLAPQKGMAISVLGARW